MMKISDWLRGKIKHWLGIYKIEGQIRATWIEQEKCRSAVEDMQENIKMFIEGDLT